MSSNNKMNHLALNQNILGKTLVLGNGFNEGKKERPTRTRLGVPVYLNGKHIIPEYSPLDSSNAFLIGSFIHPNAMAGMPSCSGEVRYECWITEKEYLIVVRLKLEESAYGESEAAAELLCLTKRADIPDSLPDTEENLITILSEMIKLHFKTLFGTQNSIDELQNYVFHDDALKQIVKAYFN